MEFILGARFLQLNNGMFIELNVNTTYEQVNKSNTFITYVVDINGFNKKPNKYGRDIFVFGMVPKDKWQCAVYDNCVSSGKIYPYSMNDTSDCTKDGTKYSCAAKIMNDGWKIKNDYPW